MNQIINIDLNKHIDNSEELNSSENPISNYNKKSFQKKFSKKVLNIQFILSIAAILIIVSIFMYYKISLNNKESFSDLLINNYSISKLYSNNNNTNEMPSLKPDSIIGVIEIPKLNISYPIFNELNDELLKTSPCKFYGEFPSISNTTNENLNLCIAGHNYNNSKFFSNIKDLNIDDKIFLYDASNKKYVYSVIKNYEVKSDDLSPVYNTITNSFELTLVTCNNFNGNRIIIKSKIEDD